MRTLLQICSDSRAFYVLSGRLVPWFALAAVLFAAAGLYFALLHRAPADASVGEVYRIVFVHVPAVWLSVFLYLVMTFWAAAALAVNLRIGFVMTHALAPTGALFSFLALWTGTIWGKPTLGAWWVWDPRLTAELVLLFVYLALMTIDAALEDARRAERICAALVLVGTANVPVFYYVVPNIGGAIRAGTIVMAVAFGMYSIAIALARARCILLEREQDSAWAGAELGLQLRARSA